MKLRKGLEPCPACGQIIAPGARKTPHPETPECLVRRTVDAYRARGWRSVGATWGTIIDEAGIPTERAPATIIGAATADNPNRVIAQHGYYVPAHAVRVCEALTLVPLTADERRRAVALFARSDDAAAALEAVKRLGGSLKHYVQSVLREQLRARGDDHEDRP